jgi:hypothetical protein
MLAIQESFFEFQTYLLKFTAQLKVAFVLWSGAQEVENLVALPVFLMEIWNYLKSEI